MPSAVNSMYYLGQTLIQGWMATSWGAKVKWKWHAHFKSFNSSQWQVRPCNRHHHLVSYWPRKIAFYFSTIHCWICIPCSLVRSWSYNDIIVLWVWSVVLVDALVWPQAGGDPSALTFKCWNCNWVTMTRPRKFSNKYHSVEDYLHIMCEAFGFDP